MVDLGLLVLFFVPTVAVLGSYEMCSPKHAVDEGNAMIGVLGEVHHPSDQAGGSCDQTPDLDVIQELEALKWAVKRINTNNYIPGFTLGLNILDTCGNPSLAIQGAVSLAPSLYLREYADCISFNNSGTFIGILGPTRSSSAVEVARVMDGRSIPHIAYSTTATSLSDKDRFPNFFRTTTPDKAQSKVMFEIVRLLGWKYIVTINSDDNYGTEGMKEFKRLAEAGGICIGHSEIIPDHNSNLRVLGEVFYNLNLVSHNTDNGPIGVVYFGPSSIAKGLIKEQQRRGLSNIHWIMPDSVGGNSHLFSNHASSALGILSIGPAHIPVNSFLDYHWKPLLRHIATTATYSENLHERRLQEYFMALYSCKFPGMPSSLVSDMNVRDCGLVPETEIAQKDNHQSSYLVPALHALYAYAAALKNSLSCQTTSCTPTASKMLTAITNMFVDYDSIGNAAPPEFKQRRINFKFNDTGDINIASDFTNIYTIYNFQDGSLRTIGNYAPDKLNLNKGDILMGSTGGAILSGDYLPVSACKKDCQKCKKVVDVPIIFIPGDLLIVGLFSVHNQGKNPFECGDYRSLTGSVQLVEAFMFALEANNATGSTGPNFGAIIFDDCYNPLVAAKTLLNFLSGNLNLTDQSSGATIDPAKVVAVVGAFSSSVTINIADFLTPLRVPLVSYGSASSILDNRYRFPYFLRTVPNLDQQAEAMVALLKKLGWNYVITLNSKNAYGQNGYEQFKKHAEKNGICIAHSNELSHEFGNEAARMQSIYAAINDILPYASKARVVILIADDIHAKNVLLAIKERNKNLPRPLNFILIGSEAWGHSSKVIAEVGEDAVGHLTVGIHPERDYYFEQYFINKRPSSSPRDLWFNLFWQDHFQCDLEDTYNRQFGIFCPTSLNYNFPGRMFKPDPWAAYTVLAVNSTIRGLQMTIQTHCNGRADAVCLLELKKPDIVESVVNDIQNVQLRDMNDKTVKPFTDKGSGNAGFFIYNIQSNQVAPQNVEYKQIGTYKDKLVLDKDRILLLDGESPRGGESSCSQCLECPDISIKEDTVKIGHVNHETDPKAIGLIIIGIVLFFVLVSMVVIFCYRYRKYKKADCPPHTPALNNIDRPLPETPEEEHRRIYTVLPGSEVYGKTAIQNQSSQCLQCAGNGRTNPSDGDRDTACVMDTGQGQDIPSAVDSTSYTNVHDNDRISVGLDSASYGTDNIIFENDSDGESTIGNVFV